MKLPTRSSNAGVTLILVISIVATLTVCVGAALAYTSTIRRAVMRNNARLTATEIGDGALELAYSSWREKCRSLPSAAPPSTNDLTDIPLPDASCFPSSSVPNFTATRAADTTKTISNYKIVAVDATLQPVANNLSPAATYGQDASSGSTSRTTSYFYLASADVTLPVVNSASVPLTVKVRRVLEKQNVSPWNWAIFYNDDLEMNPGSTQYITGWVHTNGNLYTAYSNLNYQSKVTYAGNWANTFSPNDGSHGGVTPTMPNYPSNLPPASNQQYQPFGIDPIRDFNTTDTNRNNDSYRELIEMPDVFYSDPIGQRYYTQAGIKVVIGPNTGALSISRQDGTPVTALSTGNDKLIYQAVSAAVSPQSTSFQDNREGTTMTVTNVDVSKLVTAINNGLTFNNVLYISDQSDGNWGARRAVRLINGATLPASGLTVASDNAVYIQGDYNTGSTSNTYSATSQPASNASTSVPSSPTVSGYTKAPAAVIGDAVTILSNNWQDSNSGSGIGSRTATSTTINTAIISGIVASNGTYSGGAENFPRLLENWSNKTFTYYGSLVELYTSKQSVGRWPGTGNVYNAPVRQWYFDTNFYRNPPPGTITVVNYNRGQWYLQ